MSQEEKAAYTEFKEDADSEAAQTEGLSEADGERAVDFMVEERLREVQMLGAGASGQADEKDHGNDQAGCGR